MGEQFIRSSLPVKRRFPDTLSAAGQAFLFKRFNAVSISLVSILKSTSEKAGLFSKDTNSLIKLSGVSSPSLKIKN